MGSIVEGWAIPVYVGHRRRLRPDDAVFEGDEAARSAAAATTATARHAPALPLDAAPRLPDECSVCHAAFPTAHLLDLHLAEVHDSFFAAQAARRLPVYACLVESCRHKFRGVQERKQHLIDHHKFPKGANLDRIHVRRTKAQIRPLPELRKGKGRAQRQGGDASGRNGGGGGSTEEKEKEAAQAPEAMQVDAELAEGMSRLHMASELSAVPRVIAFGHRRGASVMPGLGRGGRGRKGWGEANAMKE